MAYFKWQLCYVVNLEENKRQHNSLTKTFLWQHFFQSFVQAEFIESPRKAASTESEQEEEEEVEESELIKEEEEGEAAKKVRQQKRWEKFYLLDINKVIMIFKSC